MLIRYSKLIVIFLFLGVNASLGQDTVKVVLNVNTAEITRSTVLENSYFGADADQDPRTYEIIVEPRTVIVWEGKSTSNTSDEVKVITYRHENGPRVFRKRKFRDSSGVLVRQILGKEEESEKYTLKFYIIRNGKRTPGFFRSKFNIDPRITIRTTRKSGKTGGN